MENNDLIGSNKPANSDNGNALTVVLNKITEQAKQTEEALEQIKKTQIEIKETRSYVYAGFFVLVIMVAALVIGYLQLSITKYDTVVDKLESVVRSNH